MSTWSVVGVQPVFNIRPTGRLTAELQRREESAFETAFRSEKRMQDATDAAMNRPQKLVFLVPQDDREKTSESVQKRRQDVNYAEKVEEYAAGEVRVR
eukprot:6213863-Pleurochrysis_carterae.AAC.1